MSTVVTSAFATRTSRSWIGVWLVSLLLIFEPDLRSFGLEARAMPISVGLVRGFWLSDLGLLVPLIALFFGGRARRLVRDNTMRWITGIWAYGALIGLLRHNQFSPFAYDLRISIALLSGLALVECAPKRLPEIAVALVVVTTGGVALSLLLLLALPPSALQSSIGGRITAESAFFFIGPPLVLTAPAIIVSWLVQRRRLV